MANAADIGHGSSILFGTSGFAANIISFDPASMSRDSIDTSYMGGTVFRTFIPGMIDMGELSLDVQFDAEIDPPIDGAVESIVVTFPLIGADSAGATWTFNGFVTAYSPSVTFDGLMTASMTVKITGDITFADGS